MTIDKQPRALYLADVLAAGFECDQEWYEIESAKELRRLHAETVNQQDWYTEWQRWEQTAKKFARQRDELLEALAWIDRRCPIAMLVHPLHSIHKEMAHDAGACARAAIAKAGGAA